MTLDFSLSWQKRVYQCGRKGNLCFRVTNLTEKDLKKASLQIETSPRKETRHRTHLELGETWEQMVPFLPETPGDDCLDVLLTAMDSRGNPRVYRGQAEYRVRPAVEAPGAAARELHIHQHYQADNRGQNIIGGDLKVQGFGELPSLRQTEDRDEPPRWISIPLHYDYEASRDLVEEKADRQEKRVLPGEMKGAGGRTEVAQLQYMSGKGKIRFHLFSMPTVSIGRGKGLINLQVYERDAAGNPVMDQARTDSLSRQHAEVSFHHGEFTITDVGSTHGTSVGEEKGKGSVGRLQTLEKQHPYTLQGGEVITLGRVLKLTFCLFRDRDPSSNLTVTRNDPAGSGAVPWAQTGFGFDRMGMIDAARMRRLDA